MKRAKIFYRNIFFSDTRTGKEGRRFTPAKNREFCARILMNNKDIMQLYRKAIHELKEQVQIVEKKIKEEASKEITNFIFQDKFQECHQALNSLQELLHKLKVDSDFSRIEKAIMEYNTKIENLKTKTETSSNILVCHPNEKEEFEAKTHKNDTLSVEQPSKNDVKDLVEAVKNTILNHDFQIVHADGNTMELKKNNLHYHVAILESIPSKEFFLNTLEKMNPKKNIGFVFFNEDQMKKAKKIALEWAKLSPEYKTKFLTIHFTTLDDLKRKKTEEALQTVSF